MLYIDTNISYNEINDISESKKLDMKILDLFQTMDSYGNYTNISWLTALSKYDMIKYIKELHDIWCYRANLTFDIKRSISPPTGNPFLYCNINGLDNLSEPVIKKNIVNIIEQIVTKGLTYDDRVLGTMYVLTAFTLVSDLAAEALPWLYESANNGI